jgi:AP endonuclease-2
MNPIGTFKNGQRLREFHSKDHLALSAKLLPEFDKRRSIKDMFQRQKLTTPVVPTPNSSAIRTKDSYLIDSWDRSARDSAIQGREKSNPSSTQQLNLDRGPPPKRLKPTSFTKDRKSTAGVQKTLNNFFHPKPGPAEAGPSGPVEQTLELRNPAKLQNKYSHENPKAEAVQNPSSTSESNSTVNSWHSNLVSTETLATRSERVQDDFATRVEWTKLFSKRDTPRCEGHNEPCICLETKKKGINCGRKFYICPRYEKSCFL